MKFSSNKGSAAVVVVVIFLAAIVMFVFPLMTMSDKKDDVVAEEAKKIVTEYVNTWRTKGKITQEDYDNLALSLGATGRAYKVDYTVKIKDANQAQKHASTQTGDNVYYTLYTTQVEEMLPLTLSEGDIITVTAETTDKSISEQLSEWVYKATGKSNPNVATASGMTTATSK